jgi:hypothetical protein
MIIVYRRRSPMLPGPARRFYHSAWTGPFLNWPSDFTGSECCWIVPGTINPED